MKDTPSCNASEITQHIAPLFQIVQNVVRNLKKDIARMMPFLEAKQASGSPNVALREQAKGRRARKEKVEA